MSGRRPPGLMHPRLAAVLPVRAARRATDVFSDTRASGRFPDDVPPLGAASFPVQGDRRVTRGYVWGEEGPTALLVHGWGTDSSSMLGLVTPLRRLGLRVAAFDAPGHGVSPGRQATMTEFTGAVGAVLDTLGGAEVVIAHSLGCIAAVGAYADRTRRLAAAIVMVAPACTLGGVLERWALGQDRLGRPLVDGIYRELWRRNGVPVSHWDAGALGRALASPTLVVHDPDDPVVPFSEALAVCEAMPDARLETAPGQGHVTILSSARLKGLVSAHVAGVGPVGLPATSVAGGYGAEGGDDVRP